MKSLDFKDDHERGDYGAFRALFLATFGEDKIDNVVEVFSASFDKFASGIGSQDVFDVQVQAVNLTENAIRVITAGDWSNGDTITLTNLAKFLNLLLYGVSSYQRSTGFIVDHVQTGRDSALILYQGRH